jgi:Zn-dependent M28 family amino/carboxypeptidase
MLKWFLILVFVLICAAAGILIYFTRMPLRSYRGLLKPLNEHESGIRTGLVRHVEKLATEIGERNLEHYSALNAAAQYIESTLRDYGYEIKTYSYEVRGNAVTNIEARLTGKAFSSENLIVGAHYDSVVGTAGANDNGSGVAALLELARVLKQAEPAQTIRFVFFANEEPPYFQTSTMGSVVYANQLRKENTRVSGMLSLETIGYYSDAKGSQSYPAGFGSLYPSTGNFISFVGNTGSRELLQQAMRAFRESTSFPSEGAAAPEGITGIGWSDHWSFWQAGYRAIMVTDTAPFRYPYYHQPQDTPDKLDFDRMAQVVAGLEQVVRKLAG